MKHNKNDVIEVRGCYFKCVCADEESAVFAPTTRNGNRVRFKDLFIVCRDSTKDGFDYKLLIAGDVGKGNTGNLKGKIRR